MTAKISIADLPSYGLPEAAFYLRLPYAKAKRWSDVLLAPKENLLSYNNLLELHVLKAMRLRHDLPLQRIRRALDVLKKQYPSPHPLLDKSFLTNGIDLFLEEEGDLINLSRGGQVGIRELLQMYVERIERTGHKIPRFYPFIQKESPSEPRSISIDPTVAFGRPVLAGTGITTEVIAGRFRARESMKDLAEEYDLPIEKIEEAIRWEIPNLNAA